MSSYKKEIYHGEIHVATIVKPRKAPIGLNFATDDDKFIQLGIWNWKKNKTLDAHFHNWFKREAYRTNEFIYVVKGKVKTNLFTEEGDFIDSFIIKKNEGMILYALAHEYKILKNSIIIESKNGPFLGVEKDKTLI